MSNKDRPESLMDGIKRRDALKQNIDVDRLRDNLNRLLQSGSAR